ncbi:nuclear intron maturase 4, mitochondrial-like [Vigna umbellata]|uniref:nuclear intron maturase 4, mitochondrial-like n=1 Tax=Vigna umbellata TaxID=87088 RepID=UPI001F5E6B5E|nr:nuclear intron maturase 4, mitochondrial-like [Vigna umbellata]
MELPDSTGNDLNLNAPLSQPQHNNNHQNARSGLRVDLNEIPSPSSLFAETLLDSVTVVVRTYHENPEPLSGAPAAIPSSSLAPCAASVLDDLVEELGKGDFDVSKNTTSFSTRRGYVNKEILGFPNLRLKVVLEAMRIALEVVYKQHFSKISHGCRSGRGCAAALRLSMKYEGICGRGLNERDRSGSVLRDWFRRQLNGDDVWKSSGVKVYSCRYMDEMCFVVYGSRGVAVI